MKSTRVDPFDAADVLIAKMAKPFADPIRMGIMQYLIHHGPSTVPELVDQFPGMHPSTVKKQLRLLMRSDLIVLLRYEKQISYQLNDEQYRRHIEVVAGFIKELLDSSKGAKE